MLCPASHWWMGPPGTAVSSTPGQVETQGDADRVASCLWLPFSRLPTQEQQDAESGGSPAVHLAETSAEKHRRGPNEQRTEE